MIKDYFSLFSGNIVLTGHKYFILLTGETLNVHEEFIKQLRYKVPWLWKVNDVNKCDFILVFCPVVSRAGTDIEAALKKLYHTAGSRQTF